jgi:hypothetical protein
MMKTGALLFALSLLLLVFSSCEEVIDIELKDADQVLVIEGNVSNTETTHFVSISKTVPFSSNSTDNPQSGAIVKILEEIVSGSNNSGVTVKAERAFTEVSPGLYQINNYRASPGRKYILTVELENKSYQASSIMPAPISIDSIGTVTDSFFGEDQKTVSVVFQDPPNEKNYYRYLLTVNGKLITDVFAYNDKFNDGKTVQRNLYNEDLDLFRDDTVWVEQQCVDEAVYNYFNGIQSNNPGSAAPANPISNFSNGALGYFSAYGVTRASTVIE